MSLESATGNPPGDDVHRTPNEAVSSAQDGAVFKSAVSYVRVSTKEQAERDGDPDGYSLPAQLEANRRKAAAKGAVVVAEFVERGESAKFADSRPELQRMLAYVKTNQVGYVIVHKVDRLARNRLDDAQIHMAIKQAGAELVSATENIDETPSGMLLHGIMSSIAEFYSRNLAQEVNKGMEQKAKTGGTPGKAPLGYRNVRVVNAEGREVRTVDVDPDRAPLIGWAFVAYATGDWTLKRLAAELERRGLATRPSPKSPGRPIKYNSLHKILTTPYYMGEVTYRGVRYPGRHQPLVDAATWTRVQDVLASHAMGEKQREHPHYLKSSVFCGNCGSRLIVTMSKNRYGVVYPYFICIGRHQKTTDCRQRAVLIARVEDQIEEEYRVSQMEPELRAQIEVMVRDEFRDFRRSTDTERDRLTTQKKNLTDERVRLLQAHYARAVPLDLLKTEQDRIARQLSAIDSRLTATDVEADRFESVLHTALDYATNWSKGYMQAGQHERRLFNQAFFTRFEVKDDDMTSELAEPFRTLFDAELAETAVLHTVAAGNTGNNLESASSLTDAVIRQNSKPAPGGAGLKQALLVPPA